MNDNQLKQDILDLQNKIFSLKAFAELEYKTSKGEFPSSFVGLLLFV